MLFLSSTLLLDCEEVEIFILLLFGFDSMTNSRNRTIFLCFFFLLVWLSVCVCYDIKQPRNNFVLVRLVTFCCFDIRICSQSTCAWSFCCCCFLWASWWQSDFSLWFVILLRKTNKCGHFSTVVGYKHRSKHSEEKNSRNIWSNDIYLISLSSFKCEY